MTAVRRFTAQGQYKNKVISTYMTASHRKSANVLINAIRNNDIAVIQSLAQLSDFTSIINTPCAQRATPLHWAAWKGNAEIMGLMQLPKSTLPLLDDKTLTLIEAEAAQKRFAFETITHPRFEKLRGVKTVIGYLRILFRMNFFEDSCLWHAANHKNQLDIGAATPPAKASNIHPSVAVTYINQTMGHGVISIKDISSGDLIGEYVGEINLRNVFSPERDTTYIMDYPIPMPPGYRWSMDARRVGNFTRFINHSDEPNCHMAVAYDGFIFRLIVLAKTRITAGTELRLNYGKDYWRHRSCSTQLH